MNQKMMRLLRELAAGHEAWVVAQHPSGGELHRFCFVRVTDAMVIGTNDVVLVRGSSVPRVGVVKRFSFVPDPRGLERLEIEYHIAGRDWIGRSDVLGRAVSAHPYKLTPQ